MTQQRSTADLELAFAAFNQHSQQLEQSFHTLQGQVGVLNDELAQANSEKLRELRAKEALAQRLERLLGALPGGILVTDPQGRICECNQTAMDMLGTPLIGETFDSVLARRDHGDEHGELQLADGQRLSLSRRALDDDAGTIILLSDVTEPRALQAMLARKQRLVEMGEMAARLAHQVRTPLSSALLYTSQLGRAQINDTKRQCYAQRISLRLGQLERMVNDMLGFARGANVRTQEIDVAELLDDVIQLMRSQQREGDRFEVVIDDQLNCVQGNRDALTGALTNLCTNAIQASDAGVVLTLTGRRTDSGQVALGVKDTGPGLAARDVERIFDAFFTTRASGTGLGLAVVKSTAEAHGGDVTVESSPGAGCHIEMHIDDAAMTNALSSSALPTSRRSAACA